MKQLESPESVKLASSERFSRLARYCQLCERIHAFQSELSRLEAQRQQMWEQSASELCGLVKMMEEGRPC